MARFCSLNGVTESRVRLEVAFLKESSVTLEHFFFFLDSSCWLSRLDFFLKAKTEAYVVFWPRLTERHPSKTLGLIQPKAAKCLMGKSVM